MYNKDKEEFINDLKTTVELFLTHIQILNNENDKSKEICSELLRMLNFSEDEINFIFSKLYVKY